MAKLVWGLSSWRASGHAAYVHSKDPTLRAMWPDGQQDITEVTKRPLTAGTLFKNSMVALVENLASKVRLPPTLNLDPSRSFCLCLDVRLGPPLPSCIIRGCSFPVCCEPYLLQQKGTCHCSGYDALSRAKA